jgi:hypothetical protein
MKNSIKFAEVNTNGERLRFRRNHVKSKNGCNPCKNRRVKCDEQIPKCGACIRKKLVCTRSRAADQGFEMDETGEAPVESHIQRDISLFQFRLLYWFENNTSKTLVLNSAWAKVIPLALKVRFAQGTPACFLLSSLLSVIQLAVCYPACCLLSSLLSVIQLAVCYPACYLLSSLLSVIQLVPAEPLTV